MLATAEKHSNRRQDIIMTNDSNDDTPQPLVDYYYDVDGVWLVWQGQSPTILPVPPADADALAGAFYDVCEGHKAEVHTERATVALSGGRGYVLLDYLLPLPDGGDRPTRYRLSMELARAMGLALVRGLDARDAMLAVDAAMEPADKRMVPPSLSSDFGDRTGNLQRASEAYMVASSMCVWLCAHHLDPDAAGPRPEVKGAPVIDVIGVLVRMLAMQVGQPVTPVMTMTVEGAWGLAEDVAEGAEYDFDMFYDASRLGHERRDLYRTGGEIADLPETETEVTYDD
jgi:hypothetical protein